MTKRNKLSKEVEKGFDKFFNKPAWDIKDKHHLDVRPQFKQFLADLLAEQKKKIYKKVDILMDKKIAKELGDSLEILYGKRECIICGTNPEKQRKMILKSIKETK